MNYANRILGLLFVFLYLNGAFGQAAKIDSLTAELAKNLPDTTRFRLIKSKIIEFRKENLLDSAIGLNNKLKDIAVKTKNEKLINASYEIEFVSLNLNKEYSRSKKVYLAFIEGLHQKKDTLGLADAYYNLGANEHGYGNIVGSLEYLFKSVPYHEAINNTIKPYRALAITYSQLDELDKAFEYNEKVIVLSEKLKDYESLARAYLSKGYQYKEMKKYGPSLVASKKAVAVYMNELNKPTDHRLSLVYGNIFEVYLYYHQNDLTGIIALDSNFKNVRNLNKAVLDTIEFYLDKSLYISELTNVSYHVYNAKSRYGDYYNYLKDYKNALKYYLECYALCKEDNFMLASEMSMAKKLYQLYKNINKNDLALSYYEISIELEDSLFNQDKQRDIGREEAKFEFEKQKVQEESERAKEKVIADTQLKKEQAIAKEQRKKQTIITFSVAIGLLLSSVFMFLIIKRLKVAKAQQVLIQAQKKTIEKNRNQMLESIEYSKNIQQRMFPTHEEVKRLLPNSFLYFRPKDVVSGDFYWVHRKGNKTYFSVADCTGHGVPGAFMTLISLNLINAIILEDDITTSAALLERLHVNLKERLTSSEEEQMKHGLDIAMCAYNHDTNELEYAGLHNPIYIINKENELRELKGDNLFLGISPNFNVTNHTISLQPGDSVYLSTDGFPDQKGGIKGKKYYYSNLRNTLRIVDTKPIADRARILNDKFEEWKGEGEQIDDVCIMGISF